MDYVGGFGICYYKLPCKVGDWMYKVDNEKINQAIKKSGLKKKWIAQELDITYNTLRRKLLGEIPFSKLELEKIYKILENYINL